MQQETNKTLTKGQQYVRVSFNPSERKDILSTKQITADLIDYLESIKTPENGRAVSLAQTAYEEACMWAVKAMTV